MSFERMPPAISPDNAPKKSEIEFTPAKIFGNELSIAKDIALAKSGGSEPFTADTFHKYMDTLGQLEEAYVRQAGKQGSDAATNLVRTAFTSLKVVEWITHPAFERRGKGREISERLKNEIGWQVYAAQYLGELNRKYDQREATEKAATFWQSQEKMWRSNGEVVNTQEPFESFKNGVLRAVALEYVLTHVNGWEIHTERDATVDAINKIDMIAISEADHMFLFQIKQRDIANPDSADTGWAIHEVAPHGPKEYDYMGQFQKGVEDYLVENSIEWQNATGVYVELSANNAYINKETGVPKEEFAHSLGSAILQLESPADTAKAA